MDQLDNRPTRDEAAEVWKFVREHYRPAKHGPVFVVRDPISSRDFEFKIAKLPGDRYMVMWKGQKIEGGFIKNGSLG